MVFAKAPAGQVFEVRIDTKPVFGDFKVNAITSEVEGDLFYGMYIQVNNSSPLRL